MKREVECEGCSCVWVIENKAYTNQLQADLKQCPMCWDGKLR